MTNQEYRGLAQELLDLTGGAAGAVALVCSRPLASELEWGRQLSPFMLGAASRQLIVMTPQQIAKGRLDDRKIRTYLIQGGCMDEMPSHWKIHVVWLLDQARRRYLFP